MKISLTDRQARSILSQLEKASLRWKRFVTGNEMPADRKGLKKLAQTTEVFRDAYVRELMKINRFKALANNGRKK